MFKDIYKNIHRYHLILSPGTPAELMMYFLTIMEGDNKLFINGQVLKDYNQFVPEVSERTFYRNVKELSQKEIIFKQSRGVYKVSERLTEGRMDVPLPNLLQEKKGVVNTEGFISFFQPNIQVEKVFSFPVIEEPKKQFSNLNLDGGKEFRI